MKEGISRTAMSPKEASLMFGISEGTLANWRCKRIGPRYYKVGSRKVIYFVNDLEEWMRSEPVLTKDSLEYDR